ncbi:RICIN domain-containing protein [Streptomyces lacrimifluminis]|uniref:Beta-galactosidase n=1 Tax=Streptomyces lacrimifluminis TaxID=1500077 RepID=A0A917KPB9_9ACTN|nr:RICIN domain-containing protein [Streptomyces lacrimifluminis]GGJ20427.1 beta-galactosidase [Streptomyces lacrimifluminis]
MHQHGPPPRRRRFAQLFVAVTALLAGVLAVPVSAAAAPVSAAATTVTDINGFTAGNGAIRSVDLAGTWGFTPKGRAATSINVPGGGWYKQGFTDVNEATYSRTVTVPNSGQPQSVWIEFGAVNHEATLSVDGQVVGTQTTSFTPSNFDISAFAAPGTTHTITVNVKGRYGLKNASGNQTLVPDAANWSEAIPQGIYRSAFLRVYPAVHVSDAFVRTSVADKTLTYDVSVTNTSGNSRSVTLTGSLASDGGGSFTYPSLPSRTVTVAAHSTAKVTVGPVAWNLGSSSYWWPNVPYRSGYRAQLHQLSVHASTDDGRTSDATYRFGFRDTTQNGEYYYVNGVRVNFRGDSLQGANYDRIDNGGKGDAFDTLPGFLPPSAGNGGWPQAVDNYQRLNYNVVRIHQEPGSPYMLDVADEMGLMIIDETAIRGTCSCQDFVAGHDNMVNHAKALTLRDRNHPSIIRWSQSNENDISSFDSESFERDLYNAMNGNDGTRPVSVDTAWNTNPYPNLLNGNFAVFSHYIDGIGKYGEARADLAGRPDGEGEYVWNKANTKQGFEWFATTTIAKRAKDASDLRPYTLLSGWASFVPGVKSTDFILEEGGNPVYGENNLSAPWSNPQIQRIQAAFNPIAAVDLPYWSASGESDENGTFPLPEKVDSYAHNSTVNRNITVFNDDLSGTSVGFNWTARLDRPDGTVVASGNESLTIPLGSRVTRPISFTAPASGSRVYLVLSTTKSGSTTFTDSVQYLNLGAAGSAATTVDDAAGTVTYNGGWGHATGESGTYSGTNSYSDTAGDAATLSFTGTGVTLRSVTAPSHGIVGVSIDGGTEAQVDLYSASRAGDVAVWTSPRLTSGTHTIKVRVTGTKRAAATNDYGTIDRFVIANEPVAGTNYRIVNRNSGKALAVAGDSTADRALVVQKADGGAWTVNTAPGGAYTLTYVRSGKALDVDGYSSTVGLQLQQWTPSGGTNQRWYLRPNGDGYFTVTSHDSGLAMDVYGWETGDNARVVQWTAGGGANQQWQLVPA